MRARFIATTVGTVLTVGVLTTGSTATAGERAAVAVVVGQTGTPLTCSPGPSTWVQQATGAATPKYVVPGAGVITSFSHNANGTAGSVRAVVVGAGSGPTTRTILGYSELRALTPGTLNTFPTRIPVPVGAEIDPTVTSTYTPSACTPAGSCNSRRLNLSAVWEPDIDGDQFGDVSQDLCPQSAQTQLACPAPDTTITKTPAKRSAKRQAKIKFTSAPGARFTCAVDDKAAKPCSSPFKKRYQVGKHVVVVTAVSNVGIVDPSPAKVKFRIVEQV